MATNINKMIAKLDPARREKIQKRVDELTAEEWAKRAHSFCHFCSTRYPNNSYPHVCVKCEQTVWVNPLPVVVMIVPFWDNGYLGVKRAIEPGLGKWAFPGGYMELGETWQQTGSREVVEETGAIIATDSIRLLNAKSVGNFVVILATSEPISSEILSTFQPNSEVSELMRITKPIELAFPVQTRTLAAMFGQ